MFYTRLSYEEFVEWVSAEIEENAAAKCKRLTVKVPIEYCKSLKHDLVRAGYEDAKLITNNFSDQYKIEFGLVYAS